MFVWCCLLRVCIFFFRYLFCLGLFVLDCFLRLYSFGFPLLAGLFYLFRFVVCCCCFVFRLGNSFVVVIAGCYSCLILIGWFGCAASLFCCYAVYVFGGFVLILFVLQFGGAVLLCCLLVWSCCLWCYLQFTCVWLFALLYLLLGGFIWVCCLVFIVCMIGLCLIV